jgi:inosine/xanthosine triphosphatase
MKVIVASTNPVKIKATKSAFRKVFPDKKFKFIGLDVPSGVASQPIGDIETLNGAKNRVKNASKMMKADFYVGLEGGINEKMDTERAWMYVMDKYGKTGTASTGTFPIPHEITKLLKKGKELGEATGIVFNHNNSKQGLGAVGLLTKGIVNREKYYLQALILVLIPFMNSKLHFDK